MRERPLVSVEARVWPETDHVICEDDEPVDSVFAEREQRLLPEILYASWPGPSDGRGFLSFADVGIFRTVNHPAIVPDVLVAVGVQAPENALAKPWRSYFVEGYGKAPDVVIEIVSQGGGDEDSAKMLDYAELGVRYYVIHDPYLQLSKALLRVYELVEGRYQPLTEGWLAGVELGVGLWEGVYEGVSGVWLRWRDAAGAWLQTGPERAEAAEQQAALAQQQAALAQQQAVFAQQQLALAQDTAEAERRRAESLSAEVERLRSLLGPSSASPNSDG